jgi:hypothetical protein
LGMAVIAVALLFAAQVFVLNSAGAAPTPPRVR